MRDATFFRGRKQPLSLITNEKSTSLQKPSPGPDDRDVEPSADDRDVFFISMGHLQMIGMLSPV